MIERSAAVQQMLALFERLSYLEIGVDRGETFDRLSAAHKVAVDPRFKFVPLPSTTAMELGRNHAILNRLHGEKIHRAHEVPSRR